MNTSAIQRIMDKAIDDLVYTFTIGCDQPEFLTASSRSARGMSCSVSLDGIIPTDHRAVDRITDAIHECLRDIHSEWHRWSIRVVQRGGRRYFALFFEDACIEDLMNSIAEIGEFDLDENEGKAVDCVEYLDMLMGEREYLDGRCKHTFSVYSTLFKAYKDKGIRRTWRNHRAFYTCYALHAC